MTDVPRGTGGSVATLWGFKVRNDTDVAVTVQICRRRGLGGAVIIQVVSMAHSRDAGWGGGQHGGVRFTTREDCVVKTDGEVHVELDWGGGEA